MLTREDEKVAGSENGGGGDHSRVKVLVVLNPECVQMITQPK